MRYIDIKPKDSRAYAEIAGSFYHYKDFKSATTYAKKAAAMGNNDAKELLAILKKLKK